MLGVWAFALINGTNYNAYTETDGAGHYELGSSMATGPSVWTAAGCPL
jgi:hypothetical protein